LAAASGVCAGVALGFLITDGDPIVLAAGVLATALALGVAYLVLPRETRSVVLPIVALAILVRAAAAVVVYDGLIAAGRGGFVTGDDRAYADLSNRLARIMNGESAPFDYQAESYLIGTFVYLETAVFYFLGPKVLVVELLNAAMGGLLVAFVFDIARRVFSDVKASNIAAVLVALYPSLILWSALNLKDALALLLIAIVLWLLAMFAAQPRWWLVVASFVPLFAMASLRGYIFVGLALVIPASVAVVPSVGLRHRLITTTLAVAVSALMLTTLTYATGGVRSLSDFDAERSAMAIGANTSFADQPLLTRVIYVLLAPFPWTPRRALDLLPAPEMLLWYAALAGGLVTVVRRSHLWRSLAPLVLFVGGTLLVLLAAEGNVGTLFRHRAMVVPFVLILASPAFALVLSRSPAGSPNVARARVWTAGDGRTGGSS
jgi:dolichyl-phosphate-mannose-protein mannosyltransferase